MATEHLAPLADKLIDINDNLIVAAYLFHPDMEIIAEKNTADILATANDPKRPVPTTTFAENTTLTFGNKTLQLTYLGQYHQEATFSYTIQNKKC